MQLPSVSLIPVAFLLIYWIGFLIMFTHFVLTFFYISCSLKLCKKGDPSGNINQPVFPFYGWFFFAHLYDMFEVSHVCDFTIKGLI